ncbi:hypothetical protein N7495_006578 [Penicillium taxi]|uniref:uncharacterized protein n=1 Tax=Penicillium taxi TaxID=168475 RepID=UPI002545009C|nr:uncharacterized protein N7495_006578 [Penicillium taxi]KAJ5894887.1 hypothetical protein N7495_006578 [Penicillium taxi]
MSRDPPKKKVAIIGTGGAGMSCASTLADHPDQFEVTMIDVESHTGGQATSISLDKSKYGASWMNEGVQGDLQSSVTHFTSFKDTAMSLSQSNSRSLLEKEIKKLGRVLKCIKYLMPLLGLLPVKLILRIFCFSHQFSNKMVLPLLALFLGTGNQTVNVPSVLLERLFDDPQMKLWDYDPDTLLPNLPTMYTFPNLGDFYEDWAKDLRAKGVKMRLNSTVTILKRDSKDIILDIQSKDNDHDQRSSHPSAEIFDELVFCCPADQAKRLLGQHATWRERYVLGGVKFFNDITITHSDSSYFQSIFQAQYDPSLCTKLSLKKRKDQISFAEQQPTCEKDGWQGFQPMYYTHSLATEPEKIEMGFDCTNYQHQFRDSLGEGQRPLPHNRHVFQTIFLNDREKNLWTWDKIDESKIISKKWWHQFGHRWQHYLRVVPGMMFINGQNRTHFAGSWTLVNMHEIACISGIAAAYQLGATYEPFDDLAEEFFAKYLLVCHGTRYKKGKANTR